VEKGGLLRIFPLTAAIFCPLSGHRHCRDSLFK
jgi:hypothetical protein